MSAGRTLLLFPEWGARQPGWLRLDGVRVVGRGPGLDAIPPSDDARAPERVVLVAPGEAVALHWIDLPALAPEQARAAARLMAADVTAEPLDRVHVAVGRDGGAGAPRPMALVTHAALAGWLAQAQARALDPDHVVPEPLLIPPAEDAADAVERHWLREDGMVVARGRGAAHVATPAIAALAADGGAPLALDDDAFEAGLARALDPPVLDLRQGSFARRRRWGLDWALVRRQARLIGLILIVTLLVQLVLIARYRIEAARQARAADAIAAGVLPRAARIADGPAQLRDRIVRLRGGGLGFGATAGLLFAAVRETAGAELGAMSFAPDGSLTATITAPRPADVAALTTRLETAGLVVTTGAQRPGGGRTVADLVVRAP